MKKIKWIFYRIKYIFVFWFQKNFPLKIRKRIPKLSGKVCTFCGLPLSKMCAYFDFDAVELFWECENNCGEAGGIIEDWWPFYFGVWVLPKDLEKLGIEIV